MAHPAGSAFTHAQGSAGPGGVHFTGARKSNPNGVESAIDFFQNAANRQRMGNRFNQPEIGFNGTRDNTHYALGDYAQKLLERKKSLGKS